MLIQRNAAESSAIGHRTGRLSDMSKQFKHFHFAPIVNPLRRALIARFTTSVLASAIVAIAALAMVGHAQAPATAFINVNVLPMDVERVLANQAVLVEGGRITALGPVSTVKVPANAVRIDGQGKYLIPGLGDCHTHVGGEVHEIIKQQYSYTSPDKRIVPPESIAERRLFTWLADGVTTIRNLDSRDRGPDFMLDGNHLLRLRARAAAGELLSPRIYTSGQWGPEQYIRSQARHRKPEWPTPRLDSVPAYVAAYKAAGYDFIKIHDESPEVFAAVMAAARQVGIPAVGHIPWGMTVEQVLAAGMHSIEHMDEYGRARRGADISGPFRQVSKATRRAGTWNCVTIQAGGGGAARRGIVKSLHEAGAGLLLGTDEPIGKGIHEELELLVQETKLTPYQVLAMGTKNMAAYFRTLDESGTVTVGKRADLVLLDGNPLQNIRHTRRPAGVMLDGRWLSRPELDRRLAAIAAAGGADLPGHNR